VAQEGVVGRKDLLVRLPADLYLLLRERAQQTGKSMNQIVIEALKKHLSTEADGNAVATIEPFVKQPSPQPSIREVEASEQPKPSHHKSVVEELQQLPDSVLEELARSSESYVIKALAERLLKERRGG